MDHTFTVDDAEQIVTDDGSLTWAVWATVDDGTGVMGYGDSKDAAIADVAANVGIAFIGDTTIDPPPPPEFTYAIDLGSGLLSTSHDFLIA